MSESGFDIGSYLRIVWKRRYIFALAAMCVTTLGVLYSYMLPKEYQATSTVFIEENVINRLVSGIAVTPSMAAKIRVLKVAILSRTMLNQIVSDLDMDLELENEAQKEALIKSLQRKTSISLDERRGYFRISYTNKKPALARDYVNRLVQNYIQENTSVKREESVEATRFLAEQIEYYKKRLDDIESEINQKKQKLGLKLAVSEAQVLKEISDLEDRLERIVNRRNLLQVQVNMLKNAPVQNVPEENAEVASDPDYAQIAQLEEQLKLLRVKYTDEHPKVKQVIALIEKMKEGPEDEEGESDEPAAEEAVPAPEPRPMDPQAALERNPQYHILSVELDGLRDEEARVRADLRENRDLLRELPSIATEFRELLQKKENEKLIYDQLVSRYGKSEVSKRMELQDKSVYFRVVDPAVLPTAPVSPNRVMIIGLSTIAGLGLAFGLAYLLSLLDRSVRSVSDLRAFKLPILAVIPEIQTAEHHRKDRRATFLYFLVVGLFFACVAGVATMEFMGLTYIEDAFAAIEAPKRFEELKAYILG